METPPIDSSRVASKIITFISWILATLLGLIIGSSIILGTLVIPIVPEKLANILGWLIIILTILGAFLALADAKQR